VFFIIFIRLWYCIPTAAIKGLAIYELATSYNEYSLLTISRHIIIVNIRHSYSLYNRLSLELFNYSIIIVRISYYFSLHLDQYSRKVYQYLYCRLFIIAQYFIDSLHSYANLIKAKKNQPVGWF